MAKKRILPEEAPDLDDEQGPEDEAPIMIDDDPVNGGWLHKMRRTRKRKTKALLALLSSVKRPPFND
jgi:hypothetical protein